MLGLCAVPVLHAQNRVAAVLKEPQARLTNSLVSVAGRVPMDIRVLEGGRTLVVEGRPPRVAVFDSLGREEWSLTRRGIGPGELLFPYRIAGTTGGLVVFDVGSQSLLWLDRLGRYLRRTNLGLSFSSVSDVAVLQDGRIVVAGISGDARGDGFALHLFDSELRWIRSNVALPNAALSRTKSSPSVGSLSVFAKGSVMFASSLTSEIIVLDGGLALMRRVPLRGISTTAVDSIVTRLRTSSKGEAVTVNRNAKILTRAFAGPRGGFIAIVRVKDAYTVQYYDSSGVLRITQRVTRTEGVPFQTNLRRCDILSYRLDESRLLVTSSPLAQFFSQMPKDLTCDST